MYYLPCSSSSCSTRYSVTLWTWWCDLTVVTVSTGSPVATVDGLVGYIVVSALIAAATTVEGRNVIDVRFSFLAVLLAYVVRLCAIVSAISLVLDDTSPGNWPVNRIPYWSEEIWANKLIGRSMLYTWFHDHYAFSLFLFLSFTSLSCIILMFSTPH